MVKMSKGTLVQIAAALCISLGNMSISYMSVWPSYTMRIFRTEQSPLTGIFTSAQENLIGSVPMLGCVIGTVLGGIIADAVGRKKGEIMCGLIQVLGACLLCTARDATILIVARCILGIGGGLHGSLFSLYIGELSSPSIRGTVMSITSFGFCTGVLFSYILGWLCSYDLNNYIFLSLNVLFVIFMCTLKETPLYLLKDGQEKEALKSLKYYRGVKVTTQEIMDEFDEMKKLVLPPPDISSKEIGHIDPEKEKLRQASITIKATRSMAWKMLLDSKSSIRALITVASLITIDVSMGMVAVQTYAGILFTKAVPSLSSDLCSIALAIANIIGSSLPMFFSDLVGRRVLMMMSSTLVSGCLVILGILVRWPIAPDWMIPAMILMYCFCFQCGAGSVPFMLNAECFLPEVSTLCIVICLSIMWVVNFINLAVFGPLISLLGLHGTFFIYAGIAAFTVVFTYFIVPETSGLNTEAIQKKFSKGYFQVGRSNKDDNDNKIVK